MVNGEFVGFSDGATERRYLVRIYGKNVSFIVAVNTPFPSEGVGVVNFLGISTDDPSWTGSVDVRVVSADACGILCGR